MGVTSESLRCASHRCPIPCVESILPPDFNGGDTESGIGCLDHIAPVRIIVNSPNHDDLWPRPRPQVIVQAWINLTANQFCRLIDSQLMVRDSPTSWALRPRPGTIRT